MAQDAQGASRVAAVLAATPVTFPILVDPESRVARELGFRLVPAGALLDPEGRVVYASDDDFDIGDPRLRANLEAFLAGESVVQPAEQRPTRRSALAVFAEGVRAHAHGQPERAGMLWRRALELDPESSLIRSQIWAAEHPERFWPTVDRDWQKRQLIKETTKGRCREPGK